jgi:site-specific DNA-methyltransferase (adenine-specific)
MSIKAGKAKNWESRTGRSRKKGSQTSRLKSYISKLPDDVISQLLTPTEDVVETLKSIKALRSEITSVKSKPQLKLETKLGKLYQGDCITLLQSLEDDSLDCIFADPPFNLRKTYEGSNSDDVSDDYYVEWTRQWLDQCIKKLKPGGSIFVYNIPKWSIYIADHLNSQLTFKNWIAVDITASMPIPNKLYPSHYSLLYFIKGDKPNHFAPPRTPIKTCVRCGQEQNDYGGYKNKMNPSGLNLRDVWTDIPPVRHSKYKNRDANELSIRMLDRVLDIATNEGDLVFDPFGGSGTTYIAAEMKNRRWIGTELGDCSSIFSRFQNIESEKELLERYRKNINTLFTDRAIELRFKSGLPLDNYRIEKQQIDRVIGNRRLPDIEI